MENFSTIGIYGRKHLLIVLRVDLGLDKAGTTGESLRPNPTAFAGLTPILGPDPRCLRCVQLENVSSLLEQVPGVGRACLQAHCAISKADVDNSASIPPIQGWRRGRPGPDRRTAIHWLPVAQT